jgi:hypothetical protein
MAGDNRKAARPAQLRLAAALLGAWGFYQVLAGLYFIILRPSFLPEDIRASGASLAAVRSAAPGIEPWLQWVFAVLGGQMAAVGVLVISGAIGIGQGRRPKRVEVAVYAVAGAFSAALMSGVNFELGSDFRWLLVIPVATCFAAIVFLHRLSS